MSHESILSFTGSMFNRRVELAWATNYSVVCFNSPNTVLPFKARRMFSSTLEILGQK